MDDLQPGQGVESAEFAPSRVGGSRRREWSPLVVIGWIGVLVLVVGLGVIGQGGNASVGSGANASIGATERAAAIRPAPPTPGAPSDPAPTADPVAYTVGADATGVTIVATSVAHPVVWLFISVQTPAGTVLAWRSLSVDDPNGGIRADHGPALTTRIPLRIAGLGRTLVVEVSAYNDLGRKIGSSRTVLPIIGPQPFTLARNLVR